MSPQRVFPLCFTRHRAHLDMPALPDANPGRRMEKHGPALRHVPAQWWRCTHPAAVSGSSFAMPDVRVLAPSRMCPEHDKELELYCMEDRVIVCSHCMIFGAHKGHSCIKFPEAVAQSTPEVFVEQLHDRKNCVTQRLELCRQV
ncbi:hypothetical protein PAPYR_5244 [Paratrimastix pyriformis]|uniref:B box-type domain-containing protein n=1 Tax=Paratrimastix pyriformis TaxID=342808 RepID=A0ABQ8ULV0_9EUKA|nr:hypothetical protein PAPYR_5244 [Paratrimastix pyriformis]